MRFRAAAWLAALAVLVILLQSTALIWLLDEKEEEFIERQLNDQIEHSMELWRKVPDAALPNAPDMWLYRLPVGKALAGNVPPMFADLGVGNHEVYLGSKEYHVAVRDDESARYILAYDVEDHEARLSSLVLLTVLASGLLGLLTLAVGYLVAGRLTRRLEQLARRVEEETPGPLLEAGMDRELHAMAEALDRSRGRQQAMLDRERAFVSNLSHELRTPLTGIRTDAELLTASPEVSAAVVRRGNRIINSVDRINRLANSLLWLAREATPAQLEEIHLGSAIEAVWVNLAQTASTPQALRLDIPDECTLNADPSLLELVLRNLLENAQRHGEAGEILCRLQGSVLYVVDHGPGFAESELPQVFDRFFVGTGGASGLGLALVRHVCSASGWQVSARNAPSGGGEIRLDFGESLVIPTAARLTTPSQTLA